MNLLWLLLGPDELRRDRWILTGFGLLAILVGLRVAIDDPGQVSEYAMEACGYILVAYGLFKLAFSVLGAGKAMSARFAFQGACSMLLGYAFVDFPDAASGGMPWLFGLVFLANGVYQAAMALIIRYPRWGWILASGIAHLLLAIGLFVFWRRVSEFLVPLLLGLSLAYLGLSALRLGWRLRRYRTADLKGNPADRVRYFLDFHLPKRFQRRDHPDPVAVSGPPGPPPDLLVHVWTPTDVARLDKPDPSLVNRYLIAADAAGKIAVGHAAMEMGPDFYISHCDGDPNGYDGTEEAWRELRSKDVHGVFLPSFEEEVEHYLLPSVTVRFRDFREDQLRSFWAMYRQVTTYNLTNRNCSVAVALALEAALMGSLAGSSRIRSLFSLLLDRDLWLAHFLRWKAGEMVWTPGMILDYTVALHRLVET